MYFRVCSIVVALRPWLERVAQKQGTFRAIGRVKWDSVLCSVPEQTSVCRVCSMYSVCTFVYVVL